MTATASKRALATTWMAIASMTVLGLGGCAGGLPDVHSISSLSSISPFADKPAPEKPKTDQPLNVADLMLPGALGDIAIGKNNAPVTIVQYVSLNCASCSAFQSDTLPKLKKAYIDKGKARLIVREFPEDASSTTAALALRCVPAKDYFKAEEKLLKHQKDWVGTEAKKDALFNLLKFAGLKRDKFEACLADQNVIQALNSGKERGKTFGVALSPTFFVNAKKISGAVSFEEMQGTIEAALLATQSPAAVPKPKA